MLMHELVAMTVGVVLGIVVVPRHHAGRDKVAVRVALRQWRELSAGDVAGHTFAIPIG
jgi:hypothetical protein